MIYRLRLLYRFVPEYPRLLGMLAVEAGLAAWWTQSAALASGLGQAPPVAACRQVAEFDFSPTTPIRADWGWFPPGLECRANVVGEWIPYHTPGWSPVVAPTVLMVAGAVLAALFLAQLMYRAALRVSGRRLVSGAALLCLAALSAVLVFPVAMVGAGTAALVVIPLVLAADLGLALAAASLLRPPTTPSVPTDEADDTDAVDDTEPATGSTDRDVEDAGTPSTERTEPPTTVAEPEPAADRAPQPVGAPGEN